MYSFYRRVVRTLSHNKELSGKTLSKHKSEKAQHFPKQVHLRMQLHVSVIRSTDRPFPTKQENYTLSPPPTGPPSTFLLQKSSDHWAIT